MNFVEGEVLLVDKPVGWTSFDVVNKIRYAIQKKHKLKIKVGHAGTLDPLATGLLIICTGKFTKKAEEYQGFDKTYTGSFLLGKTTPSYDLETAFDSENSLDNISDELIHQTALKFLGQQAQIPPVFSAIKVGGKVAHKEARLGNNIELKPREVTLHKFSITNILFPEVDFEVSSSKGTYIRSLAHDFGKALGCGACLSSLRRTEVGEWKIADALSVEKIIEIIHAI
jgi:tRNA pseudouridine55 synthase